MTDSSNGYRNKVTARAKGGFMQSGTRKGAAQGHSTSATLGVQQGHGNAI